MELKAANPILRLRSRSKERGKEGADVGEGGGFQSRSTEDRFGPLEVTSAYLV